MTQLEAIKARHSVRRYIDKPIEGEKIKTLREAVDRCNAASGLHIQLVVNEPLAFSTGVWKKPGVYTTDEFDPDPFMDALNKWGLPWKVDEDPVLVD